MPFIITQHVQPAFIISAQHSQQAWIISQHCLSPLVHVKQTPISIASHLHMPIVKLQQQTIMPFIIMQQLHIPPAIMTQRFCSIAAEVLSSQTQVSFIPPLHFSAVILHRGTIIMLGAVGVAAADPGIPMPGMPVRFRSVIIVVIVAPFRVASPGTTGPVPEISLYSRVPPPSDQHLSREIFDYDPDNLD
jgi:hypothetical protein